MAARVLALRDQIDASLHDEKQPWTRLLAETEFRTGVNRLYLFLGSVAGISLWLMFGFAGQLVCNSIGFIYPAYASINAIESHVKDDDTKWLTYWVVYAIFSVVEYFANMIVGWFPFYWLIKCAFMIWLMVPTDGNGSIILYRQFVKPYLLGGRNLTVASSQKTE